MKTITLATSTTLQLPIQQPMRAFVAAQSMPAPALDRRPVVLHFAYSIGGGGAEAMLMNLAESLDPAKFRTVVVAINAKPWTHQLKRLHEAGVDVHDLESTTYLNARTLARLHAVLRAERPDIVQTWTHHADLVGGWAARVAGVRNIVWSIHCREIHRNPGDSDAKMGLFRRALAFSSRFIPKRIISCSAAAIEDHDAMGYPRAKMRWIPNGINAGRFVPDTDAGLDTRAELKLPANAPVIGFVGRFHEMKDLATFLRAAALLQTWVPEAHIVFCGGVEIELGEVERELLAMLPQRQQVHFESFRADPWRLYPALNVFSLSSRTEACPMTILEAMSCGVPCVATDVGDCGRLLEGVGQVVPMRDHSALASAWQKALQLGAAAREEIARKSRERVLEKFTIAHAARQYAETYAELVEVKS
ncbi:MAG: glycosyltransferase [Prosthecobacter sp.]|uniref:glycosyltransferase n=1 Tax=Prosthecobacter sp. TaxID=1965333 RepID=UPI0026272311|nr:glycosyltransferase [Prosthecobacter sp.]MCF7789172.1 glycosyltransferase [Prosthecobacter sp.]